ncbi:MAG: translation initiation factor IF-2 [Proteobacteria bacterium]|nr:translation initiation factor IF-2 [Pseudomonadota bacterium]
MSIFEKKSRKKKKKSSPFKKAETSSTADVKKEKSSLKAEKSSIKEDLTPNRIVRRIVNEEVKASDQTATLGDNAKPNIAESANENIQETLQEDTSAVNETTDDSDKNTVVVNEDTKTSDGSEQNVDASTLSPTDDKQSTNVEVTSSESDNTQVELQTEKAPTVFRRREASKEDSSTEDRNTKDTSAEGNESAQNEDNTTKFTQTVSEAQSSERASYQEENKQISSLSKPNEPSKEKPKEENKFARLGKAVIALPENYNPNAPKTSQDRTQDKTKDRNDQRTGDRRKENKSDREKRERADKNNRRAGSRRKIIEQHIERDDLPAISSRRRRKGRKTVKKTSPKARAIKRRVFVDQNISVANLAHGLSIKAPVIIKRLVELGQVVRMNDLLDLDTATLIAEEFEYEVVNTSFQEDNYLISEENKEEEEQSSRPPVVTIMGHVDHGKTTLLDTIRKTNVAVGEAGGITQHLSAYQVERSGQKITFIDTPGHAAFTAMRERGAQVTDIVVLVVAADDGVMPQTVEALNHAKAADVQIVVAVNKCDKPGANPDKVRQELMSYELIPEEYGGETIFVDVSALKGNGIEDLLDNILLLAEMGEYVAPYDRHAQGTVLEAKLEKGRGPVATIIVKKGTLKKGDSIVLGQVWGRIRAMTNFQGKRIKEATPSTPVEVIGIQDVPVSGDDFVVVKSDKDARILVQHRIEEARQAKEQTKPKLTLEDLLRMQEEAEIIKLNLIIKSDVAGTLEAMKGSLDKLDVSGAQIQIIHSGVGAITESDIVLAGTNEAIVIGFNVRPDPNARMAISSRQVDVRTYRVIYEALEDIEKALKGMLAPDTKEVVHGHAEIRQTFNVPRVGTVGGCYVSDGKIARSHQIRLLRQGNIIWEGRLASLQRFKDSVREVSMGYECGMNLDGFNDIKVGDEIESFSMEEVEQ